MLSRDELRQKLASADNLPSLPAVALEVLRITSSEDASIQDLARTIARDPALTAKLLQLANSSMFRRGGEATTLDEATMRLGLKTVKLMALSFSLADNLPRSGEGAFDYGAFWRRSIVMTVSARSLSRLVESKYDDEAYLCGLLSGIGQLVMVGSLSGEYEPILERTAGNAPNPSLERELLGFDYLQVGSLILEAWELPDVITQPIAHFANPSGLSDEADAATQEITKVLFLASYATQIICDRRKGRALAELEEQGQKLFGLSVETIESFTVGLESGIMETAALLNVEVEKDISHNRIMDDARQQMVKISLGTAMDLQETVSRAQQLEEENRELATRADTDALTELPNRASFDRQLEEVVGQHLGGNAAKALGILVLDIDHFKAFNDTHGHPIGDAVLREVGRALADLTRASDFAARYGGEEFVMILPSVGSDQLELVAERVRGGIECLDVKTEAGTLQVTVSVGGASVDRVRNRRGGETLLSLADECLYEAKAAGRNCCVCRHTESV